MNPNEILDRLTETIESHRGADPATSYVAKLFHKGQEAILKKVGEEAIETVMAAKDRDNAHLTYEVADLWFHTLVLLANEGLSYQDVLNELARREGVSGIVEKAARKQD